MSESNGAAGPGFRHEALMYAGATDFAVRALPIIMRALQAEQPVLVAVDRAKIALLRESLGGAASAVAWKDIRGIGGNPARIIPLWHQFVDRHRGRGPLWGFGEPIWAGRSSAELVEAQRHEQLVNLAFASADGFTLICPYDTASLTDAVIRAADHSHPLVTETVTRPSAIYPGQAILAGLFSAPLVQPLIPAPELALAGVPLDGILRFLADQAPSAATAGGRMDDLAVAIAAVLASMGRPSTRLRVWWEGEALRAELSGLEPVDDPLAGREWPPPQGPTRGLWLANQLCDLVQLRPAGAGAVVRLHFAGEPIAA